MPTAECWESSGISVGLVRQSEETHEDRGVGEFCNELGDAETAGSRAGNVEGECEGGKHDLDGEIQYVDELLAVASGQVLVLRVGELLHALYQLVCPSRHGEARTTLGGAEMDWGVGYWFVSCRETGGGKTFRCGIELLQSL